jgi:diguanylate cyclase
MTASSDDGWKARYLDALDRQERQQADFEALRRELVRALNRLALACDGLESDLDKRLDALRNTLRLGSDMPLPTLTRQVDAVDTQLARLDDTRRQEQLLLQSGLERLARQLQQLPLSARQRRQSDQFVDDVAPRLRRGVAVSSLLDDLAGLQLTVIDALEQSGVERPGLWQRLFGQNPASEAPSAVDTPAAAVDDRQPGPSAPPEPEIAASPAPDATSGGDYAALRVPVSRALDELLDTAEVPPEEDAQRPRFERTRLALQRGVAAAELVPTIDDIRRLMAAAFARDQDEFEAFLLALNERLAAVGESAVESSGHLSAQRAAEVELSDAVREGVDRIQASVSSATELEQLKREVQERIDGIGEAMRSFQDQAQQRSGELGETLEALVQRVRQMEAQSQDAERRLAEQRRLALSDALTGLPNREAYRERLATELERCRRFGRPLSLAVCDIDHFKSVNDRYGHLGGDRVLMRIAGLLREQLREVDFVARFGGEEFVMLLPETNLEQAVTALDKVREAIAACEVAFHDQAISITASFGVAPYPPDAEEQRVFEAADQALYRAKAGGRNRIEGAT